MKPTFQHLDFGSVNSDELDSFGDRIVFQTRPWLEFVAQTQNAEPVIAALREDNETLGYFTGLLVKRLGFKILGSPFPGWSTPYMGFNLKPGVSRRTAMEALTDFAFNDLKCHHMELMDRHMTSEDCAHLGLEWSMFDSFEVDVSLAEDQIWKHMQRQCRQCVRKAERSEVQIEQATKIAHQRK